MLPSWSRAAAMRQEWVEPSSTGDLRRRGALVATTDGGFSAIYDLSGNGGGGATLLVGQRYAAGGTPADTFSIGDSANGAVKSATAATALGNGAIAVA